MKILRHIAAHKGLDSPGSQSKSAELRAHADKLRIRFVNGHVEGDQMTAGTGRRI